MDTSEIIHVWNFASQYKLDKSERNYKDNIKMDLEIGCEDVDWVQNGAEFHWSREFSF